MARLGFGYRGARRSVPARSQAAPRLMVSPGSNWTGVAGSGFTTLPVDPPRATAKPAMRLIVPPNQSYPEELLVGVYAAANFGGSLGDNMGVSSVKVYYEGTVVTITEPSFETFNDANNQPVTYFGWWVRLKRDGRNGDARLYFEAVPKDSTMQNRVLGPYLFLPSATLYDLELTVAPSLPVVVGSRYQSIVAALTYCAAQNKHRPHITITEARSDYLLGALSVLYVTGKGYVTIDASVPVTIIGTATYVESAPARTKYMGMRFKGPNITIDMATCSNITGEASGNQAWLDGVKIVNTAGRGAIVYLGGPRAYGITGGNPYYTECVISDMPTAVNGASLVRGCTITRGWNDAMTEVRCAVGNRLDDHDSTLDWAKEVNAFTVTYTGPGTTATLELTGGNNANSRTFTARVDGVSVSTFTTTIYYENSTGQNTNVVAWLNGLPGWSATLQDNSRKASVLSIPGAKGAGFTARNCKNVTLQIVTMFDMHADLWQHLTTGAPITENVVFADNVVTNFVGQGMFISSSFECRDFIFVNNGFHGKPGPSYAGDYNIKGNAFSQIGRSGRKSHLIMAHNSFTQGLLLRNNDGFASDIYTLIANNVFSSMNWDNNGTPTANLAIKGNHLSTGALLPAASTSTSIGGSEADLWQSATTGDFTPKGALLANLKTPSVQYDRNRKKRAAIDCAGALRA